MTNYTKILKGKQRTATNIKDGQPARRRNKDAQFIELGFEPIDWNKWEYNGFVLSPGILDDQAGLIASHQQSGTKILFTYGTPPAVIKDRLDKELAQMNEYDAALAEGPPVEWQWEWEWLEVEPWNVEDVGEEIDIDTWIGGGS